jgi:hypothetical protein
MASVLSAAGAAALLGARAVDSSALREPEQPTPVPPPVLAANPVQVSSAPAPWNVLEVGSTLIPVVDYSDCSGLTPLPERVAALDPCFPGRRYFVAHNPGPFSALMGLGLGDRITWRDASAHIHRYLVVSVRVMRRNGGTVTVSRDDVSAQFQTCETPDATWVRVLDAISE